MEETALGASGGWLCVEETALGGKWRLALCGGDSSRGQVEVGSVWRRQL